MTKVQNLRTKLRRKRRDNARREQRELDLLYAESRLDPETVEGQSYMDIERIAPPTQIIKAPSPWGGVIKKIISWFWYPK